MNRDAFLQFAYKFLARHDVTPHFAFAGRDCESSETTENGSKSQREREDGLCLFRAAPAAVLVCPHRQWLTSRRRRCGPVPRKKRRARTRSPTPESTFPRRAKPRQHHKLSESRVKMTTILLKPIIGSAVSQLRHMVSG